MVEKLLSQFCHCLYSSAYINVDGFIAGAFQWTSAGGMS
jgi:hypothetical protein